MKPEDLQDAAASAASPPREQVELALAQVEGSASFRSSRRHRHLLRHLVERALAADTVSLKESVLAVEVFGRDPGRFDPRVDTIVRVETRRLRQRLDRYFRTEGRAAALRIELPVGSYVPLIAVREPPQHAPEATRRARDLVERGEHFLRQALSETTLEQALARFDAALRESPLYVPALVGAARAWLNLAFGWYREPGIAAEHAAEALRRALELDPRNAQAHALLAAITHSFEHDWVQARRHFRRACECDPDSAFVHSAYGIHLVYRGEFEQAETELALARRLDPQYVNARIHMVNLRVGQRRLADAQAELEGMLDIAPDSMPLAGMAGLLALVRGDADDALRQYRRALDLAPGHPACIANLAMALGFAGRLDEADATMQRLFAEHGSRAVSPYVLAVVATRCGRRDEAFERLHEAIDRRDPNAVIMRGDPSFDMLRNDSRWPSLIAALGRQPAARTPPTLRRTHGTDVVHQRSR